MSLRFGPPKHVKSCDKKQRNTTENALVHGVYAAEHILPWESEKDFIKLHETLCQEWEPQSATEKETVLNLAWNFWLKYRIRRAAQIAALRDPLALKLGESGETTWQGIERFLRDLAKEEDDTAVPFRAMVSYHLWTFRTTVSQLQADNLEGAKRDRLFAELEKIEAAMKRCMEMHTKMEVDMKTPETVFHAAYKPEDLEKILRLEAMIDARVDRNISRLVNLREYRAISAQRKGGSGSAILLPPT